MSKEQAIFLVKPDSETINIGSPSFNMENHPLPEVIVGLLDSAGLDIVDQSLKQLMEKDIRAIYPILNIPDEKYGEAWKFALIDHITSQPVTSYLLEGEDAIRKAKIIKDYLRKTLCDQTTEVGKIIKNIGHVPDSEDMDISKKVLFER